MPRSSAVDFILDLEVHGIKLGLEKIRLLLGALGNPQSRYPCVLIAGTNGKGSVTAMLAEALTRAGYRCGRYTSPHLVRLEERICINDRSIPRAALERGAARVRAAVRKLLASGRFEAPCTFFEATTALALDYFARSGADIAVLEVGMGGRFDATNAVEPILSVVTNIELDHEQYLGTTRTAIAREKAGIARAGRPLVAGRTVDESMAAIREGCIRAGANLQEAARLVRVERPGAGAPGLPAGTHSVQPEGGPPAVRNSDARGGGSARAAARRNGSIGGSGTERPPVSGAAATEPIVLRSARRIYGPLRPALAGSHQIDNAITAVSVLEKLEDFGCALGGAAIEAGLSGVHWPGRLEHLPGEPLVILDGAHNPAGAAALASYLAGRAFPDLTLVFGAMHDKSIQRMARELFPAAQRVILTRTPYKRSASPADLRASLADLGPELRIVKDPGHALETALELTAPGGAVCVCGSLYLVGAVLDHPELRARRRLRERRKWLESRAFPAPRPARRRQRDRAPRLAPAFATP